MASQQEQFRVLFRGKIASKFTQDQVATTLAKMLGTSPESLTPIFSGQQKISFSKHPIDFQKAVKTKIKLLRLGLVTEIEPFRSAQEQATSAQSEPPATNNETAAVSPTPHTSAEEAPASTAGTRQSVTEETTDNTVTRHQARDSAPMPSHSVPGNDRESIVDEQETADAQSHTNHATESPEVEVITQLETPPHEETVVRTVNDEQADNNGFEASTSETIIHEHRYTRPWWKHVLSIPTLLISTIVIALLGSWVSKQTSFVPSPASQVIENHLATENLSLIGLIDLKKIAAVKPWISADVSHFEIPADLRFLQSLGINLDKDVNDIVVSQHNKEDGYPTAFIVLGQFKVDNLRSILMTQFDAEPVEAQKNQYTFTVDNESGCQTELGISLDSKEVIVTSSAFLPEIHDLIHKSFESKPSRLKGWREYREHHPVSFAVLNSQELSAEAEEVLEDFHTQLDLEKTQSIYMGLNISRMMIDNVTINSTIESSDQAMLQATSEAVEKSGQFSDISQMKLSTGVLAIDIPLDNHNANLPLFQKHSLLGICASNQPDQ
jgi:DNA polymerase III psi subunit